MGQGGALGRSGGSNGAAAAVNRPGRSATGGRMTQNPAVPRLLDIMARLRDPARGCPWDRVQTFATIAPYTIEEAYEVAEACERGDPAALKDELGDLRTQVLFDAGVAEEAGHLRNDVDDAAVAEKMVRRHPHVFGD